MWLGSGLISVLYLPSETPSVNLTLNRTSNADSQFQIRLTLFTGFRKPVKDFTGFQKPVKDSTEFQNMKESVIS